MIFPSGSVLRQPTEKELTAVLFSAVPGWSCWHPIWSRLSEFFQLSLGKVLQYPGILTILNRLGPHMEQNDEIRRNPITFAALALHF